MDFSLSDEQQMLRQSAERYLLDNYTFETFQEIAAEENALSERKWEDFAEMGWLLVELPEKLGGLGCSFLETTVIAEELGRSMVLEPFVSTAVIGSHILLNADSPQEGLLADVAAGDLRLALADGEAGSRYGVGAAPFTKAEGSDAGYVINGGKTVVLDAPNAHKFVVTAVLDGEFSLFVVDRETEGVQLDAYRLVHNGRAADLTLDSVQVESSALLCQGEKARSLLQEALDRAVLAQVAMALGGMERVLELCAEYLKDRRQFGQPIGKFQALQHRMSEMFVEVQESRSALYRGLAHIGAEPELRSTAVSMSAITCFNAARVVGGLGIQLHGGIALTREYPVGHYFRYLTFLEKSYGDRDFHIERVATSYRDAASRGESN